ncbi:unnamed protein product [Camellia sinensis]
MLLPYNKNIDPLQELITFVFPNFNDYNEDPLSMMNRVILTPKNDNVDHINEILIEEFPGDEHMYNSIDETVDKSQQSQYGDFLNSLFALGLPPHKLLLKENYPILMLRNINPSKGLRNGTRLICRKFEKHVILAQIVVGDRKGDMKIMRNQLDQKCVTRSTKSFTIFILDPSIPEANSLKAWCIKYWVNACATVIDVNQKFCYLRCPNCNKSIVVEPEDFFLCNFCKQRVHSQPRCRFEVDLTDESGKIIATIFGSHAEKLFSITAEELIKNTSDDGQTSLEVLKKLSTTENHILELFAYQYDFGGLSQCKFNINALHKECIIASPNPKGSGSETISPPTLKKARKELFLAQSSASLDPAESE